MRKISLTFILIAIIGVSLFRAERPQKAIKEIVNKEVSLQVIEFKKEDKAKESLIKKGEVQINNSEKIKKTVKLSKKALMKASEKETYFGALQNQDLILEAKKAILFSEPTETLDKLLLDEKNRMDNVLFLIRALEWKDNPSKIFITQIAKEIILSEDVAVDMDLQRKRSLVADRIEMFTALKETHPLMAKQLESVATQKIHKEIIKFANNFYKLNENI